MNSTLILFPWSDSKTQEDFRSKTFRDLPILVYDDPKADIGSSHTINTQLLVWCNDKTDSKCRVCLDHLDSTTGYFLCEKKISIFSKTITIGFHKECFEPITGNLYHSKHPLQILAYLFVVRRKICYSCNRSIYCMHYCSICDFSICHDCVRKPPILTIQYPKRHEHILFYFPKVASMTCDVCALDDRRYFIYVCYICNFAVHKECIYFPWIIKISRHDHRLCFTSSFVPEKGFCKICRKEVDENYGGYSCVKDCYFVVHSKCAVREDVWDKKELLGVPEETYEDVMPFKEIGVGIINHFSHDHYLILYEDIDVTIEDKCCQACALRIYTGDIFGCMKCDFFLHKVCAYLPLKKHHVMHPHPLILQKVDLQTMFYCSSCVRQCNSLVYKCESSRCHFGLDVHCATMSNPMNHQCHQHTLFLPFKKRSAGQCSICQKYKETYFDCGECAFTLCSWCASLPTKFRYKPDEHSLVFSYIENDQSDDHWCDLCEKEVHVKNGAYMCIDCDTTVHIECLLGEDMCMLHGEKLDFEGKTWDILPNNRLTRYICNQCHQRCQNKIIYKCFDEKICCSSKCLFATV